MQKIKWSSNIFLGKQNKIGQFSIFRNAIFNTGNIFSLRKHGMMSLSSTCRFPKHIKGTMNKDISRSSTNQLEYFALFPGLYISLWEYCVENPFHLLLLLYTMRSHTENIFFSSLSTPTLFTSFSILYLKYSLIYSVLDSWYLYSQNSTYSF